MLPLGESCSIQPFPHPFFINILCTNPVATENYLSHGVLIIFYYIMYCHLQTKPCYWLYCMFIINWVKLRITKHWVKPVCLCCLSPPSLHLDSYSNPDYLAMFCVVYHQRKGNSNTSSSSNSIRVNSVCSPPLLSHKQEIILTFYHYTIYVCNIICVLNCTH